MISYHPQSTQFTKFIDSSVLVGLTQMQKKAFLLSNLSNQSYMHKHIKKIFIEFALFFTLSCFWRLKTSNSFIACDITQKFQIQQIKL